MFRALCAHHQELKIVLYSIYTICRWPSRTVSVWSGWSGIRVEGFSMQY